MTPVSIKHKTFILLAFVVVGFLVYSNSFNSSFHFDDPHVVSDLSFEEMLEKCKGGGSRVVAHMTFLVNYWFGGTDVIGYHIFNTLIHVGTAFFVYLFLYQILSLANRLERFEQLERFNRYAAQPNPDARRLLPPLRDPLFWPPFLGGLVFLVHPLATQSVTYITQRYTSLAGFFYIGAIVFFISARQKHKHGTRFLNRAHLVRYACSFVMAVLAMRTKELAVTLPATLLLTEYSFMQSDFGDAIKRFLYLLPLLATGLIIPLSNIAGVETISLESLETIQDYSWAPEITRMEYLLTQFKVIVGIYLKLMFWPIGQNIDHDYVISKTLLDLPTIASFLALSIIMGAALWLFKHARIVSFGILWFFVTISPTSSIVPNTEFVAEHRVYISIMALAFAVVALPAWQTHWKAYVLVLIPILLLFSGLTYARNEAWQTDLTLWQDAVAKSHNRPRPHNNLGNALAKKGDLTEAISHYSEAIRLEAGFAEAYNNLGNVQVMQGNLEQGVNNYYLALDIKPDFSNPHNNLGVALVRLGRIREAIGHYSEAMRLKPNFTEAFINMGLALAKQGDLDQAIAYYRKALNIKPDNAQAHYHMGVALTQRGNYDAAISHYSRSIHINPDNSDAHYSMAVALSRLGKLDEAIIHYSEAIRIKPDHVEARNNLAVVLNSQGKIEEAISHYAEALRIKPDYADAHCNLGLSLVQLGKFEEAINHYSIALQIRPEFAEAHNNLGLALARQNRFQEAVGHFSKAAQMNPGYADAHNNLGAALVRLGMFKEAAGRFSVAIEINPEHADARSNLAFVLGILEK